jgi:prepilin-type processing-associated H-X9-DG protein
MHSCFAVVAYVAVLLTAAVMAFGAPLGIIASLLVGAFWRLVLPNLPRIRAIEVVLVVLIVGATMFAVGVAAVLKDGHGKSLVRVCSSNLRQFAMILLMNAERTGALPQAATDGSTDRPFHTWRISMLPNIEQPQVAEAYNWAEPWDSPHNSQLLSAQIDIFQCPGGHSLFQERRPVTTSYFAVVGPQTVWPPNRGLQLNEITDRRDQTILLLEASGLEVPWGKPQDLSYDEAVSILTSEPDDRVAHIGGVNAAFADGSVRFLPVPMNRKMAEALLTARGGERIDWSTFERDARPQSDPVNRYPLIAFAIVALWPARRALRKRPA